MIEKIKATNARDDEFEFGPSFRLTNGLNLSALAASVNYSSGMGAGSKYQNTKLENREFDIEFRMNRPAGATEQLMDDKRANMYRIFNPELNPIRLDLTLSGGKEYYLTAHLQGTPAMPPDKANNNAVGQRVLLQFLATDPFIYEKDARQLDIATWQKLFKFPLQIAQGGIKMGTRTNSLFVNAVNAGQNKTGMIVRFKANATVERPALINVNNYEELRLNYTMTQGDVIEVSTYEDDEGMTITLIQNNVRTDIFNAIDLYSHFLQLEPGDNLLRYEADNGVDNLEITITYRAKSVGV